MYIGRSAVNVTMGGRKRRTPPAYVVAPRGPGACCLGTHPPAMLSVFLLARLAASPPLSLAPSEFEDVHTAAGQRWWDCLKAVCPFLEPLQVSSWRSPRGWRCALQERCIRLVAAAALLVCFVRLRAFRVSWVHRAGRLRARRSSPPSLRHPTLERPFFNQDKFESMTSVNAMSCPSVSIT